MSLNNQIYKEVRRMLFDRYSYHSIEQIQPEIIFQVELAVDSFEMFEIMKEFEVFFNIEISLDDIDNYIFQPQNIRYVSDIKRLTIQEAVDYIENQIKI